MPVLGKSLQKTVVLVGMMGSGKTAVGTALARMLGVPFVDSDHEIEAAANMTIAEIFARDGEPFFRKKESQVLARLLSGDPVVLSTGGGAYMSESNRAMISAQGAAVWLRASDDLLWNRVKHKTTRPLLRTDNPRKTLEELCQKRNPIYALADLTVDADAAYSIEEMASKVARTLAQRSDILEPLK